MIIAFNLLQQVASFVFAFLPGAFFPFFCLNHMSQTYWVMLKGNPFLESKQYLGVFPLGALTAWKLRRDEIQELLRNHSNSKDNADKQSFWNNCSLKS